MKDLDTKPKEKAFNNWRHNSIHLTFPNGNAISTVWGYCTYSDNHNYDITHEYNNPIEPFETFMQSDTVEIMILNAPEKLLKKIKRKYDFEEDSVKGWVTMKEWLEIVNLLAKHQQP
jgi:hypothetical protein